jgi:hypothetical protein
MDGATTQERGTTMSVNTAAERVVLRLMEDGSLFELDDETIDRACQDAGGVFKFVSGGCRYSFSDGSGITEDADGWRVSSEDEPFWVRG